MFELLLQTLMISPLLIASATDSKQFEWKRFVLPQQSFSYVKETVEVVSYTSTTDEKTGQDRTN
ncbi:MAG TPA: hypothetical protein IGS53_14500 [Leptolyngbyaceae cyanobacterium M33_DOE_097]|uniref:Uncharacterized protein n=1 Tax=Oscillatoriales cyanobacterium SpSt-418 TaxID=2282169 RepID=A0A7C3PHX4_9CYAN|nr:hypothetical protein [Leptolyngbyaceae cyanobacterium M33_DOE_097]